MKLSIPIDTEPSPPNPIRVETALSRFPVHRLAKHGEIAIDIREKNETGEVSIKWEVTYNSTFGQPGPLAYKLDTLIINRRIEEAPRPIPRIIRLGSLRDICRELGVNQGQDYSAISEVHYTKMRALSSRRRSGIGGATARSNPWRQISPAITWSSPARTYPTAARPMRSTSSSAIFTCRSSTGR